MPLQHKARGRVIVLLLVSLVIFAACSDGDTVTDGGGVDTSSGSLSDALPGQTDKSEAQIVADDEASEAPETSVMKPVESTDDETSTTTETVQEMPPVMTAAALMTAKGFSDFSGQRVGLIANRASVVDSESLIDVMMANEAIDLVAIFAPEHGLRATAGAGELVADGLDPITGLPVYSLYGDTRSPSPASLEDIDVLVYDLQDVGVRFYTYTATMGLAMQAAAEADIQFVVLDRPNPLGRRIAGSMRTPDQASFVSQYPIPSLHGMTSGELALAIKGERWLEGLDDLDLRVYPMTGWSAADSWIETGLDWVPPSPGLPTAASAFAYPATVLFEATTLSYGRGTDHPFQQIGAPWLDGLALATTLGDAGLPGVVFEPVSFTPVAGELAKDPQYEGVEVSGVRVVVTDSKAVDQAAVAVHLLAGVLAQAGAINAETADPADDVEVIDRGSFLDLLTGTRAVRDALESGEDPADVISGWEAELAAFDALRERYRMY